MFSCLIFLVPLDFFTVTSFPWFSLVYQKLLQFFQFTSSSGESQCNLPFLPSLLCFLIRIQHCFPNQNTDTLTLQMYLAPICFPLFLPLYQILFFTCYVAIFGRIDIERSRKRKATKFAFAYQTCIPHSSFKAADISGQNGPLNWIFVCPDCVDFPQD